MSVDNISGAIPVSPILPEQPPQETVEIIKEAEASKEHIVINWDLAERHLLAERANALAPVLWNLTFHYYGTTWNDALQDPNLRAGMERCYRFSEAVIKMLDVMTEFKRD